MSTLSEQLRTELSELGVSLVGYADLRDLPADQRNSFDYGVSLAVALEPAIINGIGNGPTKEYYEEFCRLNRLLDHLALKAAEIINGYGFPAWPQTRANVGPYYNYKIHATILPHKTVATRAGLGWIGKCALLVTEKYGSAVRITSVLTDAPLEVSKPVNKSNCGTCNNCVRNCPAEALSGNLWSAGMKREMFFNYLVCRNKTIERTWKLMPGKTICGLCILVCPQTRKYLISSGIVYDFPAVNIADKRDYEEILNLQKLAYHSEAIIYNDFTIPPLTQTLADLREEAKSSIILKVIEDRKIVGSVRAVEKEGICYIGRLIVHPEYRNKGIGKKLMEAIEKCFKGLRFELFTGHLSEKNLRFYQSLGYREFKTEEVKAGLSFIYLEKEN
ncbi:MAG TPA: GNAT family N-acetyltransferase [Desulfitobacteriaceae bacterium]|jgi:epoxyqueuosine reductase QueG/N-acetylglutamate synthase-like GNAT family acetyltransferase|nr:GNAT family N-acetyltransferase [Desulfitobacteriaceae bacterium]